MDILSKLKVFSLLMLLVFLIVTMMQFLGKDLKSLEATKEFVSEKMDILLARNTTMPQLHNSTSAYSAENSADIAGGAAASPFIAPMGSQPRELQPLIPQTSVVAPKYIQAPVPHVNPKQRTSKKTTVTAPKEQSFPASYTNEERKRQLAEIANVNHSYSQSAPKGFTSSRIPPFTLFTQAPRISQDFINRLSFLGDVLGQKFWIFSQQIKESTVYIYLYADYNTYAKHTGRPHWSGGTSSISKRAVYVVDSDDTFPILAHELTHIYFDTFFSGGTPSPLWISEGMATYFQVKAGRGAPPWLASNLHKIQGGYYFPLREFFKYDTLNKLSAEEVELWYSQSYAFTDYLMNISSDMTFYNLCKYLREGVSAPQALALAYGSAFASVNEVEKQWKNYMVTANYSNFTILDSSLGNAGGVGINAPIGQMPGFQQQPQQQVQQQNQQQQNTGRPSRVQNSKIKFGQI